MGLLSEDKKSRLVEKGKLADQVLQDIYDRKYSDKNELAGQLQRFFALRLDIEEEDWCDEINKMIRLNVARKMNVAPEKLHLYDLPAHCNHTTAVQNQRFVLIIEIQKKLGFIFPAGIVAYIDTFNRMAEEILALI